MEEEVR